MSVTAHQDVSATVAEVMRLRSEVDRLRSANDALAAERARSGMELIFIRGDRDTYIEALRRITRYRDDDPFAINPADVAAEALRKGGMTIPLTAHFSADPLVLRLMARAALREIEGATLDDTPQLREQIRLLAGSLDACSNGRFEDIHLTLRTSPPSPYPVRSDWDPAVPESLAELMSRVA